MPRKLTFLPGMNEADHPFPTKPRKKVDLEALTSPLKRIPGMDIASVRDLLDIGIRDTVDLKGRAPEALFEEILDLREQTPRERLHYIRMAVYYAEAEEPDPRLLEAWRWADSTSWM